MQYDPAEEPDREEWLAIDEAERLLLIEAYHRRARIRLPNAKVHAVIHAIVETQIALGEELLVRRTAELVMAEGLDRHQAIHAIGSLLSEHIFDLIHHSEAEVEVDANQPYFAALERLTEEAGLPLVVDRACAAGGGLGLDWQLGLRAMIPRVRPARMLGGIGVAARHHSRPCSLSSPNPAQIK